MTSRAAQRADRLAEQAFYLLGKHGFGPPEPSDEQAAELRTAAFRFTREVHRSEPLMVLARDVAGAVLELLSQFHTAGSAEKLRKACNAYEQARSLGSDAPNAARSNSTSIKARPRKRAEKNLGSP
jgi:hypothetical protein